MRIKRDSIREYYIAPSIEKKYWDELFIKKISELMGLIPQDIRYKEERFRFLRSRNLTLRQMNCLSEFTMTFNQYGYKEAYYCLLKFVDLADHETKYLTSAEMLALYSMIITLFKNMNNYHIPNCMLFMKITGQQNTPTS